MNPFTTGIQKVIAYGATIAALALLALCVILWLRVSGLQSSLDKCNQERSALAGKIEIQNQSIADWKTNADAALELAAQNAAKARQATQAAKPQIDALQAQILAGAGQSCESAIDEFRRGVK